MEEELSCPICGEFFVEPVMLQCTHHVCSTHLATQASQGHIACPVCGDLTALPPEGTLRVDRALQVVVEVYMERQRFQENGSSSPAVPSEPPVCPLCEERPATRHCLTCNGPFCVECERTSHSKSFFKSHKIVDLSELGGSDEVSEKSVWSGRMLCDEHPGEKLQFYCLDCRKPVCAHCLILGEHKGHQNTPIDQASETGKDTLNAWVEKLRQRIVAADDLLQRLRGDEQEVERGAEAQRNTINTEMDHLRELIETKRQQLMYKSALEEKQKKIALQAQIDRAVSLHGDSSSLVSRSQAMLVLPSEHAFLAVLLPLIQDMKKCASVPIDLSQHVSCSFRPLSTDPQVRSLGDLDLGLPRATMADPSSLSRLQSMARQPLANATAVPMVAQVAQGHGAQAFDSLGHAYQVGVSSEASTQLPNYSMLPPSYSSTHATVSFLGSHQLPPAQPQAMQQTQHAQQAAALMGGQGAAQSVYVYRSVHQG